MHMYEREWKPQQFNCIWNVASRDFPTYIYLNAWIHLNDDGKNDIE